MRVRVRVRVRALVRAQSPVLARGWVPPLERVLALALALALAYRPGWRL